MKRRSLRRDAANHTPEAGAPIFYCLVPAGEEGRGGHEARTWVTFLLILMASNRFIDGWSKLNADKRCSGRNHEPMRLSHINVTMPPGGESAARAFYGGLLGLTEIPKPESIRSRGGVWFDAGGLDVHVSIEEDRSGPDGRRHFGLECVDVDNLRARLESAGTRTEDGRPAPWKRFFVNDPFGNRIEIHEIGGLRV